MRIITSVGYYATGSSAVSDFCCEFMNCGTLGKYEFRFIQDPNGISDLEYNIVENNHRHNTSNAVKDFLKLCKFYNGSFYTKRYRKYFGENYLDLTKEYINNIVELESNAWWHYDQYKKGQLFYFLDIIYGKISSKFVTEGRLSLLKGKERGYYSYISKDKFYLETRKYINKLMDNANKDNSPFLVVEQLVSPSNVDRYLNYFDDIKVVIVERDPRDLYLATKEIYCEGIIPVDSVEEFCKWYKITREHRKHESYDKSRVLMVHFEDLIYNYDKTTNEIIEFIGFDKKDHINKYKYFDPNKSIKGTKLFEKYPKYKKDVEYIEKNLGEYIYKYHNND